MYRDQSGRKVLDTDGLEAAFEALGFQPNSVARVQEASREAQSMKDVYNVRKSELQGETARAIFEGDEKGEEAVRDAALEYQQCDHSHRP
jgi:hypothetical protein